MIPRIPVIIDSVGKSAVILEGTFNKNDTLLKINNTSIRYQYEFLEVKQKYADSIGNGHVKKRSGYCIH